MIRSTANEMSSELINGDNLETFSASVQRGAELILAIREINSVIVRPYGNDTNSET